MATTYVLKDYEQLYVTKNVGTPEQQGEIVQCSNKPTFEKYDRKCSYEEDCPRECMHSHLEKQEPQIKSDMAHTKYCDKLHPSNAECNDHLKNDEPDMRLIEREEQILKMCNNAIADLESERFLIEKRMEQIAGAIDAYKGIKSLIQK